MDFLRTALSGVGGLIIAELLGSKGFFHLLAVVIGFVAVSVVFELAVGVLNQKGVKSQKMKILGWILFVVLVFFYSYLKTQKGY